MCFFASQCEMTADCSEQTKCQQCGIRSHGVRWLWHGHGIRRGLLEIRNLWQDVIGATGSEGRVTLHGVVRERASGYGWPLVTGLPAGHARPNFTLPLGPVAQIDVEARELIVGLS